MNRPIRAVPARDQHEWTNQRSSYRTENKTTTERADLEH